MAKYTGYDFAGWATKPRVKCSDGRTISDNAFAHQDGAKVSLVWNHQHNSPDKVLGHAYLENRDGGMYAYCYFNDSEMGQTAKRCVAHGDVNSLSIWANGLKQKGKLVEHGIIRELSIVLAGANPLATIDNVVCHSVEGADEDEMVIDEAEICFNEPIELSHSEESNTQEEATMAEENRTWGDVFDTLNEEQKDLFALAVATASADAMQHSAEDSAVDDDNDENNTSNEGENEMRHNVFENDTKSPVLAHSEDIAAAFADAKRIGSLKQSFQEHLGEAYDEVLSHAAGDYGIEHIDYLFPEYRNVTKEPIFIDREQDWVGVVMNGVHRSPFSRIRSVLSDITGEDARALGYVKGNLKKEEVITLLRRTTDPQTVYKKQKLDRDDIIDITDFDVVAWLKKEMRGKLNEELARAILIGDGRDPNSEDKIQEQHIRPIWKEDTNVYAINKVITLGSSATDDQKAKAFIRAIRKGLDDYEGSGDPTLFCTREQITDCLLMEDTTGRVIYETLEKLKNALGVARIVYVPLMKGKTRTVTTTTGSETRNLTAILVNLKDYTLGADKGGEINMFDDFDIDYNQYKYLMETRCSGALTVPKSALIVETVFQ